MRDYMQENEPKTEGFTTFTTPNLLRQGCESTGVCRKPPLQAEQKQETGAFELTPTYLFGRGERGM